MGKKKCTPRIVPPAGLWQYAQHFARAARIVAEHEHPPENVPIVPYYLYGHAIELVLKGFLRAKGVEESTLKHSMGHDLEKILRSAKEAGLDQYVCLSNDDLTALKVLNCYYKCKDLEYFQRTGTLGFPTWQCLERLVTTLLRGTDQLMRQAATEKDI